MAKLTDTLGSPGAGREPLRVPGPTPSFLSGLAELGSQFAQIGENRAARDNAAALDDFAGGVQALLTDFVNSANTPPGSNPAPGDEREAPSVPGDVVALGSDFNRMNQAVAQGRMTTVELETRMNALVNEKFALHPDSRAEMSQFLVGLGYNGWQLRSLNLQTNAENADITAAQSVRMANISAAQAVGIQSDNLDEMEAMGAQAIRAQRAAAAAEKAAEAAKEAEAARRANAAEARADADRQTTIAAAEGLNASITPLLRNLTEYSSALGESPERQAGFEKAATALSTFMGLYESTQVSLMTRRGASPETIAQFQANMKLQRETLERMTKGPLSNFEASQRGLTFLQTRLKLDASTSLSTYGRLTAMFGQATVNGWLGESQPSEAIIKALQAEVRTMNLDPNSPRSRDAMADFASIMRGELSIAEMPAADAAAKMPAFYSAVTTNRAGILDGTITETDANSYAQSMSQIITAGVALSPAQRNTTKAALNLSAAIATPDSRRALREFTKRDPERGRVLMMGVRNASMQGLIAVTGQNLDESGVFSIRLNPTTGKYEPVADRRAYTALLPGLQASARDNALNRARLNLPPGPGEAPTFDEYRANVPPNVREAAVAANGLLNSLVETTQDDPSIPRNLNRSQLVGIYAQHRFPEAPAPGGVDQPTFDRGITQLTTDIQRAITELPDPNAVIEQTNTGGPGFEAAAAQWRRNENNDGGVTDINGATVRFGINAAFHPEAARSDFTWEQAQAILKRDYWDALGADNLNPGLARLAFDQGGVIGVPTMKRLLSSANGDIGALANAIENHYRAIVKRDPSKANQLNGWLTRLRNTRGVAERLADD